MPKVELPSYYEYLKEQGKSTNLFPFEYDAATRQFCIDKTTIELAEFDPYEFFPELDAEDAPEISVSEMPEHSLMIPSISGVIGGPKLHVWAAINQEFAAKEAVDTMHDAFTAMADEEFASKVKNEPAGFMGFDAGTRQGGGLFLQVFGNCACLGVSQDGLFIHQGIEKGFGQYELHNADSQAQRASLYAGIGHLARLANEE